MDSYTVNGWALYQHALMAEIFEELEQRVTVLVQRYTEQNDDRGMLEDSTIKLYQAILDGKPISQMNDIRLMPQFDQHGLMKALFYRP